MVEPLARFKRTALTFAVSGFVLCVAYLFGPRDVRAEEAIPGADERFSKPTAESPDFQKHVAPLLGRLGCNGRNCHGSFQGRGDFRLSLFGYDFKLDYESLSGPATSEDGNRVNLTDPGHSLILRKPALELDHEGGQRFKPDSWEYRLLKGWIAGGAKSVQQAKELAELTIEPAEVVFNADSGPVRLRVIAEWQDGQREDVSVLCRYRTNDDSVVSVTPDGVLESVNPGDTHVVAFYDNGVAAIPVLRPNSIHAVELAKSHQTPSSQLHPIDALVQSKLDKLGIRASELCTDTEFLRRASIDLTGTLPTSEEIKEFLSDNSPDKRRRKVDQLLERPAYAAWWANKLCDFTGCNPNQQAELGQETAVQWYSWIYRRLLENIPYDRLIERIVVAEGRAPGQSYAEYVARTTAYFQPDSAVKFADRPTMPHYWTRRTLEKPEEKALSFAHSFLGIRLQCAQCHKHPFAPWTQHDFQQFTQLLENVSYKVREQDQEHYKKLAEQAGLQLRGEDGVPVRSETLRRGLAGQAVPWRELYIAHRDAPVSLSLLRSDVVDLAGDDDPRTALMNWMRQPDNPWFSQAFVNRVWASYFYTGIIDPPDDFTPANPPSNAELLDWLATGFRESGFNMKWLHRQIVTSHTYQRSWKPNETNREDRRNFSRAIPRRIPAEILYDGLKQALAATTEQQAVRSDLSRRAIGHLSMRLAGTYAMHVFGKPERSANCDCERSNQPTLLQSVFMQNDPLIEQRLGESGWIKEIAAAGAGVGSSSAVILEAWLRTLGRPPSKQEAADAQQYFTQSPSTSDGLRDLMWALVNTKEFILNH